MNCAVICLSFWAEVHYNSIYPEGGMSIYLMFFGYSNLFGVVLIWLSPLLVQSYLFWRTKRRVGGPSSGSQFQVRKKTRAANVTSAE